MKQKKCPFKFTYKTEPKIKKCCLYINQSCSNEDTCRVFDIMNQWRLGKKIDWRE